MARLNVVKEPDPLLRKISKSVIDFSPRLHELLDDMTETMMHANRAVGIAAVQVGVLYRAAILSTEQYGIIEIINPTITSAARNKVSAEGCISCPGVWGEVKRPHLITVEFYDRKGEKHTTQLSGRDAVVASHEIDHMDGILFTDKIIN